MAKSSREVPIYFNKGTNISILVNPKVAEIMKYQPCREPDHSLSVRNAKIEKERGSFLIKVF